MTISVKWLLRLIIAALIMFTANTSVSVTETSSVGIIGGADGPTAIYISSGESK